jgi:hypothetical protein
MVRLTRPAEYEARQKQAQVAPPPLTIKSHWPKPAAEGPECEFTLPISQQHQLTCSFSTTKFRRLGQEYLSQDDPTQQSISNAKDIKDWKPRLAQIEWQQ